MSGFNFDYGFLLFIFTLLFNVDKKVYTSLTTYYVLFMENPYVQRLCVYISKSHFCVFYHCILSRVYSLVLV